MIEYFIFNKRFTFSQEDQIKNLDPIQKDYFLVP